MNPLLSIVTGLVAGAGHVLAGPDHLAAVAPLAADQRAKTWRVGLMWGVGHSGGVWVLAILALAFREALPIDALSAWGERLVGFVLIGIGLIGLRRLFNTRIHTHVHEHDGVRHAHIHVHSEAPKEEHKHPIEHTHHTHGALGIGMLHGLAGTAHLLGILPALLLPTRLAAVIYVIAFGIGSIIAMSGFAWLVGLVAARFQAAGQRLYRCLLGACCAASILIGAYWCLTTFGASHPAT